MDKLDINRLRGTLQNGEIARAASSLEDASAEEAASLFAGLSFEEQQELFRELSIDRAASLYPHFPYYHAYVLLHSRPMNELRAIIEKSDPSDRIRFLDELPEEVWQKFTQELATISLLPGEPAVEAPKEIRRSAAAPEPVCAETIVDAQAIEMNFTQPDGREIQVIAPTSLMVESGTIIALLGASGSGKSTMLRILAGLTQPSAGRVLWHGKPLGDSRPNAAIVFQSFALYPWLTVMQNVDAGLVARGIAPAERFRRSLKALNSVGLKGFGTAYPKELSGGMKQRVGFARALAVEPEVLFMDEPFSALDVLTAENLRNELLDLWLEKKIPTRSIFMVTHNIEEAVLMADRVIVLGRNPARIRADFRIPLPQPRDRNAAEFLLYVDYIYKVMTQPELEHALPARPAAHAKPAPVLLPHARPGGIAGLVELLADHQGSDDLYRVSEELSMDVDDLLPIVDASVLLGYATSHRGEVALTEAGRKFAEADIASRKELFRESALAHVPLLQQVQCTLQRKSDGSLPLEFFRDLVSKYAPEDQIQSQIETILHWGRFAEIFTYDSQDDRLRLRTANGVNP
jgi:NitT/TauT family transport system ATP-binding protein